MMVLLLLGLAHAQEAPAAPLPPPCDPTPIDFSAPAPPELNLSVHNGFCLDEAAYLELGRLRVTHRVHLTEVRLLEEHHAKRELYWSELALDLQLQTEQVAKRTWWEKNGTGVGVGIGLVAGVAIGLVSAKIAVEVLD